MEYIKYNEQPDKIAQKAYDNQCYIEAIQILHVFIENQARSLLMLVGCTNFDSKLSNTWDLSDSISLNDTLKVLRVLNQITDNEYSNLKNFNSLRNKIIHQLYKEPYNKEYLGVPKREYDEVFNMALDYTYFFTHKCEQIVG